MLINVKMPKIVSILTFMSRIRLMLSCVEHGKSFITLGPVFDGVSMGSKGPNVFSGRKLKTDQTVPMSRYLALHCMHMSTYT